MPRVSKKQAEQNHAEVIAAASKLFRAKGINSVSVPALMAEAGLTHGAFYGHFGSKEELAAAACTHAIEQSGAIYDGLLERHGGDQSAALTEFVKRYTSRLHRDQPGLGCPIAALADDASREEFKGPVRKAFAAGLERMIDRVRPLLGRRGKTAPREQALADIAMLVGALVLARATKGNAVSDEVLMAARKSMLPA
jgi:TetR/AcrR family transcriptional regulator, transcriptional repressor for nem operon